VESDGAIACVCTHFLRPLHEAEAKRWNIRLHTSSHGKLPVMYFRLRKNRSVYLPEDRVTGERADESRLNGGDA
jgi:hypothetical protein